jgi:hypothetical protein
VLGYGSIFAADPHVTVLGVPDYPSVADDEEDGLIKYITQKVMGEVKKMPLKTRSDDGKLKERIRVIARKASKTYTGKGTGPVTTVNITRI